MIGAVAEFERALIRERVVAGLARARRLGRKLGGRQPALDARGVTRARRMSGAGKSVREVAAVLGVGVATVHRALRST